jgi:signal-transduction protein with cAMP-binding, CBS, and nucleotidyltransferase domain
MATVSKQAFKDLMNEMPDLLLSLKRHIYRYEDPLKTYTSEMMIKLPYFDKNYMNKHIFHKILYCFQMKFYGKGDLVLKEDDEIDQIIFVVHGSLEIFTEFEGNDFIIETLKPGSILNYKTMFMDDTMKVQVRSK